MTTFTKVSNIIFRGTILASLTAAAGMIISTGAAMITMFPERAASFGFTVDNAVHPSGLISSANVLTGLLLIASICSILAFKCAGKIPGIFRTLTLLGLTALASGGTFLIRTSDIIVRSVNGTASAAELSLIKPIFTASSETGASALQFAGTFTAFAMAAAVIITIVLGILTITSAVSLVKTFKKERNDSDTGIKAPALQNAAM